MEFKICQRCNKELPISNFYFRKESGKYRNACKKCKSVVTKEEKRLLINSRIKKCKICNIEKSISEYNKAGGGNSLQPYCKPCDAERKRKYILNNIEKVKAKRKERYEKNKVLVPEEIKKKNIEESVKKLILFNKTNKKKMSDEERKKRKRECDRAYRLKNKEKLKQKKKEYSTSEKEKEKARRRQSEKMSDIGFRIKKNLRGRVYVALKRGCKSISTMELLGCSVEEFRSYFESKFTIGMSWEKYLEGGIHIDHIIPCVAFDLTKEDQQKICFHYTNLQPLWATDNLKKGTSLNYKI